MVACIILLSLSASNYYQSLSFLSELKMQTQMPVGEVNNRPPYMDSISTMLKWNDLRSDLHSTFQDMVVGVKNTHRLGNHRPKKYFENTPSQSLQLIQILNIYLASFNKGYTSPLMVSFSDVCKLHMNLTIKFRTTAWGAETLTLKVLIFS